MTDTVLVLNAGSSSLKFAMFDMATEQLLIDGIAERLNDSLATVSATEGATRRKLEPIAMPDGDHQQAVKIIIELIAGYPTPSAVGHRVVHGGEFFSAPIKINDDVIDKIKQCSGLAPLHNPANLTGITAAMSAFGNVPHVAIFDTAFHSTLTDRAFLYALPRRLHRDDAIRKYGFHGTSHQYITETYSQQQQAKDANILIAHLGNGCSATAVKAGRSVDTSMGMTPLEGLMMGTRSGSLDPAILLYLQTNKGMCPHQVDNLLNKESGLLGVSELTNDMRELEEAQAQGHEGAKLAIELFCFRLAKELASLAVSLPTIDALVFTGGIGENSPLVRAKTVGHLNVLGIHIDEEANDTLPRKALGQVSPAGASPKVWVIPTNEELMIALQTNRLVAT